MASAIIHGDVIIMFFVILSCKMLFSLKCLILSFKGSNKYCCTRYQQKPVSVKRSAVILMSELFLNISFKTVKNRHICANPEDEWVITHLQKMNRVILMVVSV
uniref:Uncharacterized protein n=1 Tax=Neolamprologus brichardi TaxID=32507 RepID=A0A3Q4N164_NEOBR